MRGIVRCSVRGASFRSFVTSSAFFSFKNHFLLWYSYRVFERVRKTNDGGRTIVVVKRLQQACYNLPALWLYRYEESVCVLKLVYHTFIINTYL